MAMLIPASDDPREVRPAHGPAFTLAELQGWIGGYLEPLYLPDGRIAFLNEDGKRLRLAPNPRATALLREQLRPDDTIVGAVLLCTRREAGEDDPEADDA